MSMLVCANIVTIPEKNLTVYELVISKRQKAMSCRLFKSVDLIGTMDNTDYEIYRNVSHFQPLDF